ncbi:hypothetical protein [Aeromonas phage L9-6]|nr:hypothetical protein [Aeromonas phage L9-6]
MYTLPGLVLRTALASAQNTGVDISRLLPKKLPYEINPQ